MKEKEQITGGVPLLVVRDSGFGSDMFFLSTVKDWFKTRYRTIDGKVLQLHYLFTAAVLILFSAILVTRQYVGNPIDCNHSRDIDEDVLNTYCWLHSTYTMRNAFAKGVPRIYPGVSYSRRDMNSEENVKEYRYYQWVPFFLIFQVCI